MRQFLGGAALKATLRLANNGRQERCAVAKSGRPSYSPGSLKSDEIQIFILRIVPLQALFLPSPSFKLSFPNSKFSYNLFCLICLIIRDHHARYGSRQHAGCPRRFFFAVGAWL